MPAVRKAAAAATSPKTAHCVWLMLVRKWTGVETMAPKKER